MLRNRRLTLAMALAAAGMLMPLTDLQAATTFKVFVYNPNGTQVVNEKIKMVVTNTNSDVSTIDASSANFYTIQAPLSTDTQPDRSVSLKITRAGGGTITINGLNGGLSATKELHVIVAP